MIVYNLIFGPIVMFIGIVIFVKKYEIVANMVKGRNESPMLIKKEDGTQDLAFGVRFVLNMVGGGFFFLGFVAILDVVF